MKCPDCGGSTTIEKRDITIEVAGGRTKKMHGRVAVCTCGFESVLVCLTFEENILRVSLEDLWKEQKI